MSGKMKKNINEKKEEVAAQKPSGVIIRRRASVATEGGNEVVETASTDAKNTANPVSAKASSSDVTTKVKLDKKVTDKVSSKEKVADKVIVQEGAKPASFDTDNKDVKAGIKKSKKSDEKALEKLTDNTSAKTLEKNAEKATKPAGKASQSKAKVTENIKSDTQAEAQVGSSLDVKADIKNTLKNENKTKKAAKKITDEPARIIKPAHVAKEEAQSKSLDSVQNSEIVSKKAEKVAENVQEKKAESAHMKSEQENQPVQKDKSTQVKQGQNKVSSNAQKEVQQKPKDKNTKEQKDKQVDAKFAPEASAAPDRDSAKSILPPVGAKATRVDHGGSAIAGEEPKEGQVRVISRPEANTARVIEKAAPYQKPENNRGDGNNFRRDGGRPGQGAPRSGGRPDNRDGGNRPPRGDSRPDNRGGNFAGRDNARPPFDKDKDASQAPRQARPSRPSTPRPSGDMPFTAMPIDNDQSRKKRNKGRRTVEFGQNETGDNFRRRNLMAPGMEDDETFRHRRSRKPKKQQQNVQSTQPMKAAKRKIRFEEAIRVADIAHQMSVKSSEIIKALFNLGVMATINNALDIDTATLIASEFGYEVEKVGFSEDSYLEATAEEKSPENQTPRPPVVTIMGHVDHGKTSLLDAIRKTSVTTGEAGGITQHIGAYHVSTKRGDIVFLDTPGHEAFTAMRARGAQVTDLVVLVVAADDGVMEQTREAVNHSKAAGVPILVAVNKIDKEGANPDRVLRELAELGLQAEDWGGDTVVGYVSAKTGEGLDDLLELIALQAEIMELTANKDKPARGRVVEAKLDKGRGPVATVLIQEGTLRQGDVFVCGVFAGRVRAFFNDQGRKVKEAGPSIPVEIQGFDGVPEAGEEFICLADEKAARRIAEARAVKQRERELAKASRVTLETFLASTPTDTEAQVLNLVLKADVQGSLEAITDALHKLSTEKVRISVIHSGAGAITETDIMLAAASHGIIIGFNVRPTAKVKEVAEHEMVDIRFYDIIYKLVEEIRSAMAGMLAPVSREVYLGQAEVRQPFSVPKVGVIAGSMVNDGKIQRNAGVRLLRDGIVVYTGKVISLRRMKDDVKEVSKGFECGIGLENYNDIKEGDILECFEMIEEAAIL